MREPLGYGSDEWDDWQLGVDDHDRLHGLHDTAELVDEDHGGDKFCGANDCNAPAIWACYDRPLAGFDGQPSLRCEQHRPPLVRNCDCGIDLMGYRWDPEVAKEMT